MNGRAVCTFEAETWRLVIERGELDGADNGMVVDVVDRDTGEVRRLVRADGEWKPT
jgi:hypothetical protein